MQEVTRSCVLIQTIAERKSNQYADDREGYQMAKIDAFLKLMDKSEFRQFLSKPPDDFSDA